jgi:hypothetical protein
MGDFRRALLVASPVACLVAICACASGEMAEPLADDLAPSSPVPNPPARYQRLDRSDAGITLPDGGQREPQLEISCGGQEPYVCSMSDGSFRCSSRPCVPDCDRVGCLGGEICLPCDGGFRCVTPGSGCN